MATKVTMVDYSNGHCYKGSRVIHCCNGLREDTLQWLGHDKLQ